MNVVFNKDLQNSYMVFFPKSTDKLNAYKIKMLFQNDISNILKFRFQIVDDVPKYIYDITDKQSLKQYLLHYKTDYDVIFRFLKSLSSALTDMKNYLLNEKDLLLLAEYIFIDLECEKFYFCYYPYLENDKNIDLRQEFLQISTMFMKNLDDKDDKAKALIKEMSYKSQMDNFSINNILDVAAQKYYAKQKKSTSSKIDISKIDISKIQSYQIEEDLNSTKDTETSSINKIITNTVEKLRSFTSNIFNKNNSKYEDIDSYIDNDNDEKATNSLSKTNRYILKQENSENKEMDLFAELDYKFFE